jgi:hypothetical protein
MSWLLRIALGGKESVDSYAGVLVPLEEAHLHSHSARIGRCEFEEVPQDDDDAASDDGDSGKDRETETQGMLEMSAAEYTIEGLKKQVRRGRKGQWTDYECEFLPSFVSYSQICGLGL